MYVSVEWDVHKFKLSVKQAGKDRETQSFFGDNLQVQWFKGVQERKGDRQCYTDKTISI